MAFFSSSSSSSESVPPLSTSLVLHSMANIPPPLPFYFSDYADFGGFHTSFPVSIAHPSPSSASSHDAPPVPLQILDSDEVPIVYRVPTKPRRRLRRFSGSPIEISDDTPSPERGSPVVSVRIPQTRSRKRQEDATFLHAPSSGKKRKTLSSPSDSVSSSDKSDILIRTARPKVRKSIFPKPPRSSPKSFSSPSPPKPSSASVSRRSVKRPTESGPSRDTNSPVKLPGSDFPHPSDPDFPSILHFNKRKFIRGRVVTGFGGPDMDVLVSKIDAQGWSKLLMQGDVQQKFAKPEMYEYYGRAKVQGTLLSTTVRGHSIHLVVDDIARILDIPNDGWDYYTRSEWPNLDNLSSALQICRKFSGNPSLTHHCRVPKRDMSPLHQLYFDVVHKILVPRKERRVEANYLDMTLMELLDSEIPINLPSLMFQHMQRVLIQDGNGHALPYGFWLALIFEDFEIPVQVWDLQTIKDVVGRVDHARLPASMRKADTPLSRLQLELDASVAALVAARRDFIQEKAVLSARIADLEATLAKERADHLHVVHKLTLMIPSGSPPA